MFNNFTTRSPRIHLGITSNLPRDDLGVTSDLPQFASVQPQFHLNETSKPGEAKRLNRVTIEVPLRQHRG
jgi:hypothetical protein